MASIVFGAGTSHTPMLNAAAEEWPLFEELDRQRAHLHKDGRRATYDELLAVAPASLRAELAPEKLARRHGEAMAAVSRLRDGLAGAEARRGHRRRRRPEGDLSRRQHAERPRLSRRDDPQRAEPDARSPGPIGQSGRPGRSAPPPAITRRARRGIIRSMPGSRNHLIGALDRPRVRRRRPPMPCPRAKAKGMRSASSTSAS